MLFDVFGPIAWTAPEALQVRCAVRGARRIERLRFRRGARMKQRGLVRTHVSRSGTLAGGVDRHQRCENRCGRERGRAADTPIDHLAAPCRRTARAACALFFQRVRVALIFQHLSARLLVTIEEHAHLPGSRKDLRILDRDFIPEVVGPTGVRSITCNASLWKLPRRRTMSGR